MKTKTMKAFEEFEARFGDQSNVIRIGRKASDLIGIGTEYLVRDGQVIAKLQDGVLVRGLVIVPNAQDKTAV